MRRLFIIDLTCYLPYGHNAMAIDHFSTFLKDRFDKVIPIVCKDLPESIDYIPKESRVFPMLYSNEMSLIEKTMHHVFKYNSKEQRAAFYFRKIIKKYNIGPSDCIFCPSVNFYEILGIYKAFKNTKASECPKINFRFINVNEFAGPRCNRSHKNRQIISKALAGLKEKFDKKIIITTEVKSYSKVLEDTINQAVDDVIPYPSCGDKFIKNNTEVFTVLLPGSAREDKGFFRLKSIIQILIAKHPDIKIKFVTQVPSEDEIKRFFSERSHYLAQLRAMHFVTMLPSTISQEEMIDTYRNCDAVLMPYSQGTYTNRGSAVYMETINYEIPVITSKNLGFSEYVTIYNNGILCDDTDERFADAIYQMQNTDKQKIKHDLHQAKTTYKQNFYTSLHCF
jgi:glycosyltransferase involved in cell wall biosynthesis